MRLTLALASSDVGSLLASFLPLQVRLAGDGERYLAIGAARSHALVPGVGLRLDTTARIHWEALGVGLPLAVRSLTALLRPSVAPGTTKLAFGFAIEAADFVGMPGFLDQSIVDRANEALARANLAWDFGRTLGRSLALPETMTPVSRVDLHVQGGEVTVTGDAVLVAVDLTTSVARDRSSPQ